MVVKVSNTLDKHIEANYRMQGTINGNPNPVITIRIQPRALLNDVAFPSEAHYEAWQRQNKDFLDAGILIVGKATEKQILATNAKVVESSNKRAKAKTDKAVEAVAESADKVNAKVQLKVEAPRN